MFLEKKGQVKIVLLLIYKMRDYEGQRKKISLTGASVPITCLLCLLFIPNMLPALTSVADAGLCSWSEVAVLQCWKKCEFNLCSEHNLNSYTLILHLNLKQLRGIIGESKTKVHWQ